MGDGATGAASRACPAAAYSLTKAALLAPAVERVERLSEEHDRKVVDIWASADVQTAIRGFLEQTVGQAA